VIGSVEELEKLSGQKVEDLHRPYIDEITIEKGGKVYKRIPEVLDSWFEAGSMPYAQLHYPFENQDKFEKNFPGDYIIEYIAQVRAWFNMMHRLSTALFEYHSFKNVITTGVMAGDDGRKMSKTYGNYTDPKEVLETIGGDSLRLYLMNSPLMVGENANFDLTELKNKSRNVLNPLWNSLKFFLIYANYHDWKPSKIRKQPESGHVLDRWIITRLHEVIRDFTINIEAYLVPQALQPLEDFVDDLSRWYVRRSRERIANNEEGALETFYYVLSTFSRVCAPAIPFMAEEIYQNLSAGGKKRPESVHLEEYPSYDAPLLEKHVDIMKNMKIARSLVSAALSIRANSKLPVRQPLRSIIALREYELPEEFLTIVKDETNVKEVIFVENLNEYDESSRDLSGIAALDLKIDDELRKEGMLRDIIRKFQDLRKKNKLNIKDEIKATYPDTKETQEVVDAYANELKDKILAKELVAGEDYHVELIK